jgi:hypothetical protein
MCVLLCVCYYSIRLAALEPAVFNQVVQSLIYGTQSTASTSARSSLHAIRSLVTWHLNVKLKSSNGSSNGHSIGKVHALTFALHMIVLVHVSSKPSVHLWLLVALLML